MHMLPFLVRCRGGGVGTLAPRARSILRARPAGGEAWKPPRRAVVGAYKRSDGALGAESQREDPLLYPPRAAARRGNRRDYVAVGAYKVISLGAWSGGGYARHAAAAFARSAGARGGYHFHLIISSSSVISSTG